MCFIRMGGHLKKDNGWDKFFEDNERYSDIINGIGCQGQQIVKASDLSELDIKVSGKYRDMLRKAAFGVGFAIIGIENQETIDYGLPIRILEYDIGHYRRQKNRIAKRNKYKIKNKCIDTSNLEKGEFLYKFFKSDKVYPVVTFILYAGEEPWKGPTSLHDVISFQDVPDAIQCLVENYKIHVVDIRRLKDTSIFKTDVKQVFDFLKCTEDEQAMLDLMEKDMYYKNMDIDAYEVVKNYANISKAIHVENYQTEGGVNVCKAITDLIEDSRAEGREEGIKEGVKEGQAVVILNMLNQDLSIEKICLYTGCDMEFVRAVKDGTVA